VKRTEPPGSSLTVAVIGAGRLGHSLALRAARAGFRVLLEDVLPSNLNRARAAILRQWGDKKNPESGEEGAEGGKKKAEGASDPGCEAARPVIAGHRFQDFPNTSAPEEPNLAEPDSAEANLAKPDLLETLPVVFVSSIEDAVRPAALVIDCVPDELESKLEILWLLDRMAPPHAVFATPTRALSIADLAACTYRPDKCVALALEPADLEKLAGTPLEVRTTAATSGETCALLERFWRALGFEPVFRLQA
jgi:3-hydroxybutyryl-CoA dehydrogenase